MSNPDPNQLPDGWPATAYIDGWLATTVSGYYYDRFHNAATEFDPEVIAADILDIYERFDDGYFVPRAVLIEFGRPSTDLQGFVDRSGVILMGGLLTTEHRTELLRLYPDTQELEVDGPTAAAVRQQVKRNIASDSMQCCRHIEVLAAEFTDLPVFGRERQDRRPPAYLDGLDSGYSLTLSSNGRPLEASLSLSIKRGQYGVEDLAGTKRIQATIAGIVETMPAFEVRRPSNLFHRPMGRSCTTDEHEVAP
jgi:hypothetical protein